MAFGEGMRCKSSSRLGCMGWSWISARQKYPLSYSDSSNLPFQLDQVRLVGKTYINGKFQTWQCVFWLTDAFFKNFFTCRCHLLLCVLTDSSHTDKWHQHFCRVLSFKKQIFFLKNRLLEKVSLFFSNPFLILGSLWDIVSSVCFRSKFLSSFTSLSMADFCTTLHILGTCYIFPLQALEALPLSICSKTLLTFPS